MKNFFLLIILLFSINIVVNAETFNWQEFALSNESIKLISIDDIPDDVLAVEIKKQKRIIRERRRDEDRKRYKKRVCENIKRGLISAISEKKEIEDRHAYFKKEHGVLGNAVLFFSATGGVPLNIMKTNKALKPVEKRIAKLKNNASRKGCKNEIE